MTDEQQQELDRIRHYVGTIKDFKSFWDAQAGGETNAFSTPEKQGYGIHPTRDEVDSEHWKNVKTNEGLLPMFEDFK
jgi:hypothetical protein